METNYLESVLKQANYYKSLGEKTFDQIQEEKLFWQYNEESNSIAIIVQHLTGNMLSRWTDFLTTDGEKEWRQRDAEFECILKSKEEVLQSWNRGWKVFLEVLQSLKAEDLSKIVYIRNQGHTVIDAINRQLAHYPYHVGQIVFIGKMCATEWHSLSIPKGNSQVYNQDKFAQPKQIKHFTDEFLSTHWNKDKMKQEIVSAHHQLWEAAIKTSSNHASDKWSPAQQVQHINKGSGAFAAYLKMDKAMIAEKFGTCNKESKTYEQVKQFYELKLKEGVKSTERFNPEATATLEEEIETGKKVLESLLNNLDAWSDAELRTYCCPHPTIGMMTALEMTYFTVLHAIHHAVRI